MKVLIDGENLRHQLAHVLHTHKLITDKNAYFPFDWAGFLNEALNVSHLNITYYTTKIKQPQQKVPLKLQKRITVISKANRRLIADLTNQKINVIKSGYLRVRESTACVHCGKKTLMLQEKGVDVRLATDLVGLDGDKEYVVLVSSDSDLVPAIEATKKAGQRIIYVCYAGWLNRSVASQANKTITFDDALVLKHHRGKK